MENNKFIHLLYVPTMQCNMNCKYCYLEDNTKDEYKNYGALDTLSYAIYPIEDDNYKEVIDKIKKIEIENNKYNSIKKSELITKEQICVIYLSDYIDKIYNDIDLSYKILSKSMKEKYTTLEEYKNYINNNIDKITTEADKCSLEKINNNRLYTVIDKNKNKYIFNEESIMNYEVDFYLYDNNTENK